ncbi:MAG: Fe(2+)-trafficking protein [Acidobacteriota bacterium]
MKKRSLVFCKRCSLDTPPAEKVTYGGKVGKEIRENVCEDCWQEWVGMEVMVINELRLNFMDPNSLDVLTQHMREFFKLAEPVGASGLDGTPADVRSDNRDDDAGNSGPNAAG